MALSHGAVRWAKGLLALTVLSTTGALMWTEVAGASLRGDRASQIAGAVATSTVRLAPGRYTGTVDVAGGRETLSFYVSNSGSQVQDVFVFGLNLNCGGGTGLSPGFKIGTMPLLSDGDFGTKTTSKFFFGIDPATITYRFLGHYKDRTATGEPQLTGTLDETLADTKHPKSCTSGTSVWTVTRDKQPRQTAAGAPAGRYSGTDAGSLGGVAPFAFFASASTHELQDVSMKTATLSCSANTGSGGGFNVASVPIKPDGSFASTTKSTGFWYGTAATFTYDFVGHFHSVGGPGSGVERAAGQLTESVTNTGPHRVTCTTGLTEWSVTRNSQPTQTSAPPPSGSYGGNDAFPSQNSVLTFAVGSGTITSVKLNMVLTCAYGSGTPQAFAIPSVTVLPSGAFHSTTTSSGMLFGYPATITDTFEGHFHGVGPSGKERAAGQLAESITNTAPTPATCTSGLGGWTASHS